MKVEDINFTAPVPLGGGEWFSSRLGTFRLAEVKFVTPAYLASLPENESAVEVIRDRETVRAYRRRMKRDERALRRAQSRGKVVRRISHRQGPHGRHRILIRRPVE